MPSFLIMFFFAERQLKMTLSYTKRAVLMMLFPAKNLIHLMYSQQKVVGRARSSNQFFAPMLL